MKILSLSREEIENYIRRNDRRIKTKDKTMDELQTIYIQLKERKTEVNDIESMLKSMNIGNTK